MRSLEPEQYILRHFFSFARLAGEYLKMLLDKCALACLGCELARVAGQPYFSGPRAFERGLAAVPLVALVWRLRPDYNRLLSRWRASQRDL
jgi:hypothetical protein